MPSPRDTEVRAIEEAHRAAQARLGVAGAYLAMAEWGSVSPLNASETGSSWVARSLIMINAIRRKSTRLAVSYIRLVRALETGYTLGYPEYSDDPDTLTMGDLRKQFTELLLDVADITTEPSNTTDSDEKWFESELRRIDETEVRRPNRILMADTAIEEPVQDWLDKALSNDSDSVVVEPFEWNSEMTRDDIDKSFQKLLERDVVEAADRRAKSLAANERIATYRKKLQENHDAAGSIGGGYVDHGGISAGREVIDHVVHKDKRVKVYARGTRPGCCAFCAMLAASGWHYATAKAALHTTKDTSRTGQDMSPDMENGMRLFHRNCKCFVIVRFVDVPDLPETNAYFESQWNARIKGKYSYKTDPRTGKGKNNALNAWRNWLNQERRANGTYDPKNR